MNEIFFFFFLHHDIIMKKKSASLPAKIYHSDKKLIKLYVVYLTLSVTKIARVATQFSTQNSTTYCFVTSSIFQKSQDMNQWNNSCLHAAIK